jgi:hypothetical protein
LRFEYPAQLALLPRAEIERFGEQSDTAIERACIAAAASAVIDTDADTANAAAKTASH